MPTDSLIRFAGPTFAACAILIALTFNNAGYGQDADRVVTGRPLQEALSQRRSLIARGITLRKAANDLQAHSGIAVLMDRRTDPSTVVDVETDYVTTREVITALASSVKSNSVSLTDQYAMIGPESAIQRLRTLHEINRNHVQSLRNKIDSAVFRKIALPKNASWGKLAQPRQLLTSRATAIGLTIENPESIPHDLWAAAKLPDLPFADFATLVLHQFDQTFELSLDGNVQIVDLPERIEIEKRHRVSTRDKDTVVEKWEREYPELKVTWKGSTAVITATVETHERLNQLIRIESETTIAAASIRDRKFSMKAPRGTKFGQLIGTFKASGVPIRINGKSHTELRRLLEQTTEFEMKDLSGNEFFVDIFKPWNADVVVKDDEVVVTFPK